MATAIVDTSGTPAARPKPRTGYLPSLDGWRALAIIAVLLSHDDPGVLLGQTYAKYHGFGGWGVFLFFAISGFLVTTRILENEALLGRFHIGAFYVRRVLRIQPAALVFLAVIGVLSAFHLLHERPSALFGGLFLYQNYLFNKADTTGTWVFTGHFWTLAIEEHFYLLLSLLLFAVRRNRVWMFAGVVAALLLWQRLAIHLAVYHPDTSPRRTELNLQYLFVPALLAVLLRKKELRDLGVRWLQPWVAFAGTAALCIPCMAARLLSPALQNDVPTWSTLLFYGFGFWVVATVLHPRSVTTRFLEWRPLRFIGRISYSLYLWHLLFFICRDPVTHVHNSVLLWLGSAPWRYVAAVSVSLLSYYGIEKPFIRLGHRIAPPATPGHADLGTAARGALARA